MSILTILPVKPAPVRTGQLQRAADFIGLLAKAGLTFARNTAALTCSIMVSEAFGNTVDLEGQWICGTPVSSGISSDGGWEAAETLRGAVLRIAADQLVIDPGPTCRIEYGARTVLYDDMKSWGSFGGSWSDLGLRPGADRGYRVEVRPLDCGLDSVVHELIWQQPKRSYLLIGGEGHVWSSCVRVID